MFISKKVLLVCALVLALGAVSVSGTSGSAQTALAQQEVAVFNSRYIYLGNDENPAIFDTHKGIYRVWDSDPDKVVKTYSFEDHTTVARDIIKYR